MNRREFIGEAAALAAVGVKPAVAGDSAELAAVDILSALAKEVCS